MASEIKNVGASVRTRLLDRARREGSDFQVLLTRYALERLLYRLSQSKFSERFVLKGALLLITGLENPHRPTRDLDLLGYGDPDPQRMLEAFRKILATDLDDGITFDIAALRIDRIREELEYGGLRLRTTATIAGARVAITIDIGFGGATEPGIEVLDYPTLLDLPKPRLKAHAPETVIAEKFQAMVMLGQANSRMKDFYDIWNLSRSLTFDPLRISAAIKATFERRNTPLPTETPLALTASFSEDPQKQQQWLAFCRDIGQEPGTLSDIIGDLRAFLLPYIAAR